MYGPPMIDRRAFLAGAAGSALAGAAAAAPARPFDEAAFAAAQKADLPILIEVTATWCPVCKVQKPILARLLAGPRFGDMLAFEVDYDTQRELQLRFGTRMQSTLIVFRGTDEMGRSVGDTNPVSIEALLSMGL